MELRATVEPKESPTGRRFRGTRAREFFALLCILILWPGFAKSESTDGTLRWWVELPRAVAPEREVTTGPVAPRPNARALARRAARGRADRVAALRWGPEARAVEQVRRTGAKIVTISRWLSRVSVEASPRQTQALIDAFGATALSPVGRRHFRDDEIQIVHAPKASAVESEGDIAYGPSADQIVQVQADRLHALGFSGRGVRILVLDTGFVRSHSALDSLEIVDAWDFVFDDAVVENEAEDPPSQHNHGTGVLAVMAGRQEGELVGPAFGAEVLLAKTEFVGTETRVEEDAFVAALEWGEAQGIDMASASLGYLDFPDEPDSFFYPLADLDGDTAVTTRAVDDLVALGVVVLSAMGNAGPEPSTLISPADSDSALAVGAVRLDGTVATFSSRGPTGDGRIKPDLCARGTQATWALAPEGYATAGGTSVATPIVAGVVALLLEAHPEWGPGEVTAALRQTATQSSNPDNERGWGIAQAFDAVFDVAPPQYPLPFELSSPPDGSTEASPSVNFGWQRAVDLQQGFASSYRLHVVNAADRADTLLNVAVGADTTFVWNAPPELEMIWVVVASDEEGHARSSAERDLLRSTPVAAPAPTLTWVRAGRPRPNPFNPRVELRVELGRPARLWAELWDVAGRSVRRLRTGEADGPGTVVLRWNGTDDANRPVASGVYLLRLRAESSDAERVDITRRMVLVR